MGGIIIYREGIIAKIRRGKVLKWALAFALDRLRQVVYQNDGLGKNF